MRCKPRKGVTLILSMVFVSVFCALAAAIFSASDTNVQVADNHRKANMAFSNAESGLEVLRFWLGRIKMPSSTPPDHYLQKIIHDLRHDFLDNSISNIVLRDDGSIPAVSLDSLRDQKFSAIIAINASDPCKLVATVTGYCDTVSRTIQVAFEIVPYKHPIFNFGLATKGPLHFPNNPTLVGESAGWEADIYVESFADPTALFVGGNTNFDGDINIGNPAGAADFVGDVIIAGDHGEEAIANHVFSGVEPAEFPVPDTERFRDYATGDVIDASADFSKGMTITNGIIPPGTNPTFDGSVIIQGILFVEAPNVVTFSRNVDLRGVMVADGNLQEPGTNAINVLGNFGTGPYPAGAEFDAIRQEAGTSIIAPGFSAAFSGNYSTIEGVMAVSGVHFSGNASAVIKGTIINCSDSPAVVEGNTSMTFDRAGGVEIPAGFDTKRVLEYDPRSYAMVH